jgi:hypothetical protein
MYITEDYHGGCCERKRTNEYMASIIVAAKK